MDKDFRDSGANAGFEGAWRILGRISLRSGTGNSMELVLSTGLLDYDMLLTPAKKPQVLVPKRKNVEMRNTGLFPHTAAAGAVEKVPDPVASCSSPTRLKDI
jgi:hypothetical protein